MENLTNASKHCIFLNHIKLIQNLYGLHGNSSLKTYTLKPQIFNFNPKIATLSSETFLNTKLNRKRKPENEAAIKETLYLEPFINEIKQKCLILPSEINEHMPRLWEDQYEFPQFRGANNTNEFQTATFAQQIFIIPPKTKFFNYNIKDFSKLLPDLETYDLLIMDMPWQNKYIKRLKKVKSSLAYRMLDNETLKSLPIPQLIHANSLVVLWCTNALQHRKAIEEQFLPNWNLQLVHCLKWFKINTSGDLISPPKPESYKQPYELIYIACPKENSLNLKEIIKVDFLISIPSIIHSHKPPLIEWLKKFLTNIDNFKGLEIFARYLQPNFTSIGIEVLKLMDKRLYNESDST